MPMASVVHDAPLVAADECDGGTERLLHELEERARAEAAAVLGDAERQASEIRAAAASRGAERHAAAIRACDDEVSIGHAEALADARLAARRRLLEAQHAAVARVLEEVRRVAAAEANDWSVPDEILDARVAEVLSYLGGDPAELHCPPALVERISALARTDAVSVRGDPAIEVGVRASTLDGRVTVDDTLDAWLLHDRAALAIEICRIIGGADD